LLSQPTQIAKEILESKYAEARVIILAGSIVRGEGTPYSDLDLVVIFDHLISAYPESFYFHNFPVEAFARGRETLNHFFSNKF
jgi:predicted nucleotidyltransferase